jgi:hypothetical protein
VIRGYHRTVREDTVPFYRLTLGLIVVAFVALVAYWVVWFFVDRAILASANTEAY